MDVRNFGMSMYHCVYMYLKMIPSLDMISNRTKITYISRVCLLVLWFAVLHWLTRSLN